MSDAMTLFGGAGNALVSSDLFKGLLETTKLLAGSGAGVPRISIKGGRFREIIGGEQVRVFKGDQLNVVILNAAPIARTYYEGVYDSNVAAPPVCWSADTKTPSADVPEESRMASSCAECPMNIKGSGQGDSRACRFSQRLAVMLEGDEDHKVYQMQLPATSIFGEAQNGQMGMQAYTKLLVAHNTPVTAIVTGATFDENTETPKLHFKPVRPLDEDELREAVATRDSDAVKAALAMTVSQADGGAPKAAAAEKPKSKAKPKAAEVEDEGGAAEKPKPKAKPKAAEVEDEEPVKRTAKATKVEPEKSDLASIIGAWDDDDEDEGDDD